MQFEPNGDHQLAMRILKIVEPVQDLIKDYDGRIRRPVEGELVKISDGRGGTTDVMRHMGVSMEDALKLPVHLEDVP